MGGSGTTGVQPSFEELGTTLFATTFVVLDLETTGLSPERDRITEIGAVKVRGGEVLGELRSFVHPGRAIPAAVTTVTGITDAMVRDAPRAGAVLPTLLRFLGDAVLVAHNARFDVGFLRAAAAREDLGPFDPVVVDTASLARRLVRDEVRDLRLGTLARFARSRHVPEHRALADARATVDVLHALIERAGSMGATTLEDLRELTRSTSDRRFRRISLVREAPSTCGVYRFLDARDEVLYVGKATDLRSRLRSYFGADRRRRTDDLVRETARVTWTPTATLLEAEVRELREIRHHLPRYNRRSKRVPTPAYVAVTREPFPRLSIVTTPRDTHRCTFGPLPSKRVAEEIADALRAALPIRPCTDRLRIAQDHRPCVLKQLDQCGAPCDGTQHRDDYDHEVARLEAAVDDPTEVLERLRSRMLDQARRGRFERAASERQRLHTLARVWSRRRRHDALAAVTQLVVSRPTGDGEVDLLVIRRGRLAGTVRVSATADDAAVEQALALAPLTAFETPPGSEDHEEIALIVDHLERPGVRVRHVDGHYALPVPGGAVLAALEDEARRVARDVHRDRQALRGDKVRRAG